MLRDFSRRDPFSVQSKAVPFYHRFVLYLWRGVLLETRADSLQTNAFSGAISLDPCLIVPGVLWLVVIGVITCDKCLTSHCIQMPSAHDDPEDEVSIFC